MPKVRKRKQSSIQDIEEFTNGSEDLMEHSVEKMIRTTVSFTDKEHKQLKTIAKEEGRTLQSQVRHMIKNILF